MTKYFQSLTVAGKNLPEKFAKINQEVWAATPWVTDVFVGEYVPNRSRDSEIRSWLNHNFGNESNSHRNIDGNWRQSNVTIHGYCYYGFKTELLMNLFLEKFPSPDRNENLAANQQPIGT